MATTINADTVTGGAVVTGDASGQLALQAAGVTKLTVASGGVTLASPLPVASGGTGATSLSGIAVGNLSGGSNGTIPYQSASGTTQMLAVGTAGQLLQTNGAGAPTWVTPSTSALVLVATTTATPGASTMAITSGFSSTYENYLLLFSVACQENQGTITVEVQVGGSYSTSIGYFNRRDSSNNTTEVTNQASASTINMCSDLGGSSDGSKAGTIAMTFINATSTTNFKTFSWQGSAPANLSPPGAAQINGGGGINDTAAITGVRVSCPSRFIRNGTMRLYAYANS